MHLNQYRQEAGLKYWELTGLINQELENAGLSPMHWTTFQKYCHNQRTPTVPVIRAIEKATNGAVALNDWHPPLT